MQERGTVVILVVAIILTLTLASTPFAVLPKWYGMENAKLARHSSKENGFLHHVVQLNGSQLVATARATNATGSCSTNSFTEEFNGSARGGTPPYTFYWNFGDGSPVVENESLSHFFNGSEDYYNVSLMVVDSVSAKAWSNVTASARVLSGCQPPQQFPTLTFILVGLVVILCLAIWIIIRKCRPGRSDMSRNPAG